MIEFPQEVTMALVGGGDIGLAGCTGVRVIDRGRGQHKFEVPHLQSPARSYSSLVGLVWQEHERLGSDSRT